MKTVVLTFFIILNFMIPLSAFEIRSDETPLYPLLFLPNDQAFFNLWGNPTRLLENKHLQFHTDIKAALHTSLPRLLDMLNGDYDLIAYWVDQLAAGGYGTGTSIDMGIEGPSWVFGLNSCLDIFAKGPVFPEISYSRCTFTTSIYGGFAFPLTINDFTMNIGITVSPFHRLKVPITTESYTNIILNIINWDQASLKTLFSDTYLYQGLGLCINASGSFTLGNTDILIAVDNVFNTYVFYQKYDLGSVADNPRILCTSNDSSVDHVGLIPMDISLYCSRTWNIGLPFLQDIELGYGLTQILEFFTANNKSIIDIVYFRQKIHFLSILSILLSIYHGTFSCMLTLSFPHFSIDFSSVFALNHCMYSPAPRTSLIVGISTYF